MSRCPSHQLDSYVAILFAVLLPLAAGCAAAINPVQIDAAQTAARVKTALVNDSIVGTRSIEVRVSGGVVELAGQVASDDEAARAVELARQVPGVLRVESRLQVVGTSPAAAAPPAAGGDAVAPLVRRVDAEFAELEQVRDWLAAGAAVRVVDPRGAEQAPRWQVSPIIRLGNRRGFGPAVAFDWYSALPRATSRLSGDIGRVNVRPVMAGLRYTVRAGRWSLAPSLVGGVAFNGLVLAEAGDVERLAVGVATSLAWRPAVAVWFDSSRRTAVHASVGRVFTRPRFAVVEDGLISRRPASVDATLLLVGLAYKVF